MSLAETRVELVRVLQAPETACQAAMPAWDRLLRLARRSLLLGTLGERFETTGRFYNKYATNVDTPWWRN